MEKKDPFIRTVLLRSKKGIVPDALSHCVKERVDRIWSPKSDAERARRSIQQHFEALMIEERI